MLENGTNGLEIVNLLSLVKRRWTWYCAGMVMAAVLGMVSALSAGMLTVTTAELKTPYENAVISKTVPFARDQLGLPAGSPELQSYLQRVKPSAIDETSASIVFRDFTESEVSKVLQALENRVRAGLAPKRHVVDGGGLLIGPTRTHEEYVQSPLGKALGWAYIVFYTLTVLLVLATVVGELWQGRRGGPLRTQ